MAALEGRFSQVEREVSHLRGGYAHLATKADLANLENRLIKWMMGWALAWWCPPECPP